MRVLLALDSRVANKGGFLWLDLSKQDFHFQEVEFDEDFKRVGFRGFCVAGDMLYAVNSAALYSFRIEDPKKKRFPELIHLKTLKRPEWALGKRAAADLHHVLFSASRDRIFVANSFMDCIEEISPDGTWRGRKYLWDVSDRVMDWADGRKETVSDLVHVNHLLEYRDRIYLTLGNINGTRDGCVLCFDTGEIVLDGLRFPHDGIVHENTLYIANSDTSEICVYDHVDDYQLLGRQPDHLIPISIQNPDWQQGGQWVRGIAVSERYIIVGSSQFRADRGEELTALVPPRLIFIDRNTREVASDLFLPELDSFPNPCIYSIHCLDRKDDDNIVFSSWPPPNLSSASSLHEVQIPDPRFNAVDDAGTFEEWRWYRSSPIVDVSLEDGAVLFEFELQDTAAGQYLVSGKGTPHFDRPATDWDRYQVAGDTETAISIDVLKKTHRSEVKLFALQYDSDRRTATNSLELKEGANTLRFQTLDATRSIRIAIRFAGQGAVRLKGVRLEQRRAA